MAILKIARMGNEVLNRPAEPVKDIERENIATLARDMRDTLEDIGANGLAAPQVHVLKRVIVYRITESQIPEGAPMKPVNWQVLINPTLENLTDEISPIWERCLSIPGMHGEVPRYTSVRVVATGLHGETIDIRATGFHAMLLQHEYDHLDGILYPMRMEDMSKLSFNSELGDTGFFIKRSSKEFAGSCQIQSG